MGIARIDQVLFILYEASSLDLYREMSLMKDMCSKN